MNNGRICKLKEREAEGRVGEKEGRGGRDIAGGLGWPFAEICRGGCDLFRKKQKASWPLGLNIVVEFFSLRERSGEKRESQTEKDRSVNL